MERFPGLKSLEVFNGMIFEIGLARGRVFLVDCEEWDSPLLVYKMKCRYGLGDKIEIINERLLCRWYNS